MDRTEIRLAGFGGQGVILAGMILGRAAPSFENLQATLIPSFGPAPRGGAGPGRVGGAGTRRRRLLGVVRQGDRTHALRGKPEEPVHHVRFEHGGDQH